MEDEADKEETLDGDVAECVWLGLDAIVLDELLDAIEWLVLVREIELAERICCFGF